MSVTSTRSALCWSYLGFIINSFYILLAFLLSLSKHVLAISISTSFLILTVPISIFHTFEHVNYFVRPKLQSQIVRIIWMVPVYAFESSLSIIFYEYSFYFQAGRELYEAYVIYCYMRYLLHYLGEGKHLAVKLSTKSPSLGIHKAPCCYLTPWQMGSEFINRCKAGVSQYVVTRLLLTVISLILHPLGWYKDGDYSIRSSYLYMTLVNCGSQWWALYSLLLFYQSSELELASIRPLAKLLCIKFCIFFTWWQGIFIAALVRLGHINGITEPETGDVLPAQKVADGVQDLLVSMEMLFVAIAFLHAFPVLDFQEKLLKAKSVLTPNPSTMKSKLDSIMEIGKSIFQSSMRLKAQAATSDSNAINTEKNIGDEGLDHSHTTESMNSACNTRQNSFRTRAKSVERGSAVAASLMSSSSMEPTISPTDTSTQDSFDCEQSILCNDKIADQASSHFPSLNLSGLNRDGGASSSHESKLGVWSVPSQDMTEPAPPVNIRAKLPKKTRSILDDNLDINNSLPSPRNRPQTTLARRSHINISENADDGDQLLLGEESAEEFEEIHERIQGVWKALWVSSVPMELHEDLTDLGSQFLDSYLSTPYNAIKKWKKGSNAIS